MAAFFRDRRQVLFLGEKRLERVGRDQGEGVRIGAPGVNRIAGYVFLGEHSIGDIAPAILHEAFRILRHNVVIVQDDESRGEVLDVAALHKFAGIDHPDLAV